MEKKLKVANHKYICDKCNGNGYIKINAMTIQCAKCKSHWEAPPPLQIPRTYAHKKSQICRYTYINYAYAYRGSWGGGLLFSGIWKIEQDHHPTQMSVGKGVAGQLLDGGGDACHVARSEQDSRLARNDNLAGAIHVITDHGFDP